MISLDIANFQFKRIFELEKRLYEHTIVCMFYYSPCDIITLNLILLGIGYSHMGNGLSRVRLTLYSDSSLTKDSSLATEFRTLGQEQPLVISSSDFV